jgi:hypothetical protein
MILERSGGLIVRLCFVFFHHATTPSDRPRMADRSVDKREQYVAFATHCLQLAKVATDGNSREILREMAAEWLKLAEVAG